MIGTIERRIDRFARRRVLTVAGGAVAAASLLRPGQAQADCFPGGPQQFTTTSDHQIDVYVVATDVAVPQQNPDGMTRTIAFRKC